MLPVELLLRSKKFALSAGTSETVDAMMRVDLDCVASRSL
jgi:hypothetical protein